MRKVKYGSTFIEYSFHENDSLKSHYITVEKNIGVILKGKAIPVEKSDKLILKKARWILDKLNLVSVKEDEKIVTGSRITYLGRSYYVEVIVQKELKELRIDFNHSKFKILLPFPDMEQSEIQNSIELFYQERAVEKITPRVKKFSKQTGLIYEGLKFRKLEKSWGNCSGKNVITINPAAIKLPYSLIDYLIVHELCHTKVKDHSKQFWAELSTHVPNWKELNERVEKN
ncbi:M48 family metallopeptidase [Dyadobacter sp. CY345]|uniref:M48 family metallopeptidase n=1 Tax=Dyadobacter sp. CY345 TaxID=2909335 RepID=UPI001F47B576|nr:YgjP-like metallopeptidase domain-containing protein [Dyadobacter sp. CY345]MCF2446211.1 M48 family metallopeptidase [Dyadobacter sp. CY345]